MGRASPAPFPQGVGGTDGAPDDGKKKLMKDRKLREYLKRVLTVCSAGSGPPQMVYGDDLKQDCSEARKQGEEAEGDQGELYFRQGLGPDPESKRYPPVAHPSGSKEARCIRLSYRRMSLRTCDWAYRAQPVFG